MRTTYIALLVLLMLAVSCRREEAHNNERKTVTEELSGDVLHSKNLPSCFLLAAYKDCLICDTYDNSAKIAICRVEGDSLVLVDKGIKKGRGPHEVIYANYCQSGDSLFVLDSNPMGFNTLYGIPLGEEGALSDYGRWKEYHCGEMPQMITTGYFAKMAPGKFLVNAAVPGTEHIFTVLDFKDGSSTSLEFWPEDGNECETEVKQMVYINARISALGNGSFVYAAGTGRYLAIMEPEDLTMQERDVIYSVLPKFTSKNHNISYEKGQYQGITMKSTENRIYVKLYPDDWGEIDDYKGYPSNCFDEIEIYDLDGRFIKCVRTDRPYSTFCPSSDDKYLYTTTYNLETGEDVIVRYDLGLI